MNELDLAEGRTGFRLDSMELYNWGTFGQSVWTFPFGGGNSLVTGDIGSGKSTWVDALSTLLVPPQRITYNKAAGAERRERTDRSYVLGEFRSSRDEGAAYSKPIYLRDEGSYSLLLAVFTDAKASRLLTLAQLRWLKAGEIQRIYVSSGRRLSILEDFKDFDGDGAALRKRLRQSPSIEVFDSFSDYSSSFRASMGISEKALDLFNQTVSMKTIGDLDSFIRDHMLEPSSAAGKIEDLLLNFDNLRAAHDAVESSRLQRDALLPLRDEGKEHLALAEAREDLEAMAGSLPFYILNRSVPLLERELTQLGKDLEATKAAVAGKEAALDARREDQAQLRSAIDNSEAGRRIVELEAEMQRTAEERDRRRVQSAHFKAPLDRLGKSLPKTPEAFASLRVQLAGEAPKAEQRRATLTEARDARFMERRLRQDRLAEIESELESLRGRTTSIPARVSDIRADLARAVGAQETDLPFAGELIRVAEAHRNWEGAAERILHPFALSMLVPERLYKAVSSYARNTRLGGKLVFYRVPQQVEQPKRLSDRSLAKVFEVKRDAPFRAWLEAELGKRADYARCENMDDFYREPDAVIPEGLVKSGRIRHEKDDRSSVADPRNFVLGWSNAEKTALLERDKTEAQTLLQQAAKALTAADQAIIIHDTLRSDLQETLRFDSFDDIDLDSSVQRYKELKDAREELERSSDQLASLKAALDAAGKDIAALEVQAKALVEKSGGIKTRLDSRQRELETNRVNLVQAGIGQAGNGQPTDMQALYARLDTFITVNPVASTSGLQEPSLEDLPGWQIALRQRMDSRLNSINRKDSDLRSAIQKRMHEFLTAFKERSAELSTGIDFLHDYMSLLEHIERDDLPSFESRFRNLLRESTLRDIALFQMDLENNAQAIRSAIDTINLSLESIEYNPGTYITLSAERREDQDVRDFRAELRRCLENTLGETDLYSEEKFMRVKRLLTRFASGDNADKAWTEHVTDARSWFTFTASERWKEDDTEKEFYSSSSGKSGGQKEKLAYTILASALAYQYGQGNRRLSSGFRLVVIDEAFGRGSEESTRYGLRLFASLDLQLILVTPLQKIGVIEGSVATIHFIANPGGSASEVRSLGMQDYEEEKATRTMATSPADTVASSPDPSGTQTP
ncbi:MAG: SbcC/MukB-like Walker B domain-containing protein [Spirochaetota bacterium]